MKGGRRAFLPPFFLLRVLLVNADNGTAIIADANHPEIRLFGKLLNGKTIENHNSMPAVCSLKLFTCNLSLLVSLDIL